MKKTLLSFFLLTFVAANLFAQDGKTAKADSILFDKVIHEYGPIVQGGDGTCEFTFTNKGSVPVVLSNVRAVSYTHLRAHETVLDLVCRLLLEKKKHN